MISARFRALTANSKQLRTAAIIKGFIDVQDKWAKDRLKELKKYPPPRGDYDRTGNLFDGWHQDGPKLTSSALTTRIYNDATDERDRPYAQWVYGTDQGEMQAWMHVGRWVKLSDVLDRPGYLRALQGVVRDNVI